MNNSKVAIIGELRGKGGAERVILELAKEFNADIYPIPYQESFPEFENFEVQTQSLISKKIPLKSRIFEIAFSGLESKLRNFNLDLSKYDFVIIGKSTGVFAGIKNHPNIYYCHGPPSYLFQHKDLYTEKYGIPFVLWSNFQEIIWGWAFDNIDKWLANSKTTKKVMKEMCGVDAQVVYPPVYTEKFKPGKAEDYFLSVQNLSAAKRVHWQVKAFNQLNEKLVVVGSGPEKDRLEDMANENIEFKGGITDEELVNLYSHCKGVIQTNPWEDFGIVPIEGMASGKPAICPKRAGFTETIIDGETGILFDEPFVENLKESISSFKSSKFDSDKCLKRSKEFSTDRFRERVREIVEGEMF